MTKKINQAFFTEFKRVVEDQREFLCDLLNNAICKKIFTYKKENESITFGDVENFLITLPTEIKGLMDFDPLHKSTMNTHISIRQLELMIAAAENPGLLETPDPKMVMSQEAHSITMQLNLADLRPENLYILATLSVAWDYFSTGTLSPSFLTMCLTVLSWLLEDIAKLNKHATIIKYRENIYAAFPRALLDRSNPKNPDATTPNKAEAAQASEDQRLQAFSDFWSLIKQDEIAIAHDKSSPSP